MQKNAKKTATQDSAAAPPEPASRAGWAIPDWCAACSISRATFYNLSVRPRTAHVGRRHVIIEAPGEYLRRVEAAQAN